MQIDAMAAVRPAPPASAEASLLSTVTDLAKQFMQKVNDIEQSVQQSINAMRSQPRDSYGTRRREANSFGGRPPQRQRQPPNFDNRPRSQNVHAADGTPLCNLCHGPGHIASQCDVKSSERRAYPALSSKTDQTASDRRPGRQSISSMKAIYRARRLFSIVHYHGVQVKGMHHLGAHVSAVRTGSRLAKKFPWKPSEAVIGLADQGAEVKAVGECTLSYRWFGSHMRTITWYSIPNLDPDVILGTDVLLASNSYSVYGRQEGTNDWECRLGAEIFPLITQGVSTYDDIPEALYDPSCPALAPEIKAFKAKRLAEEAALKFRESPWDQLDALRRELEETQYRLKEYKGLIAFYENDGIDIKPTLEIILNKGGLVKPKRGVAKVLYNPALSAGQRAELEALVSENRHAFANCSEEVGATGSAVFHIHTTNKAPIQFGRNRHLPQAKHVVAQDLLKDMLREGIVEKSTSPYNTPLLLVSKKDGSYRMVHSFEDLNEVTIPDAADLPVMKHVVHVLKGCKWYSQLDMASGYWQVPLAMGSREKTAFACGKHYQFTRMPQGVVNGPSAFARLMQHVLAEHCSVNSFWLVIHFWYFLMIL